LSDKKPKTIRIAVIRTSSIGDVVLASACLNLAAKLGVEVVWLGREPALGLLKMAWPDVSCVVVPQTISKLSMTDFFASVGSVDVVVDLQTNLRSRALLRLFRKRGVQSVSSRKFQRRRLFLILAARLRSRTVPTDTTLKSERFRQYKVMLDAFAKALIYCGLKPKVIAPLLVQARPDLSTLAKKPIESSWGNDLKFGTWIAIAPGASYPTKQAPLALWKESLSAFSELQSDHPTPPSTIGLLITGSDTDRKPAVELLDSLDWQGPVLNMAGKLSLVETAQALSKVKVLLTNDSGLLHIAESVGTPVLAVFGPTSEDFGFPPWRKESQVFSSPIGCRPCSKHGKAPCRYGDKLCFEAIATKTIGQVAINLSTQVSESGQL
jgi:ADP-heptose:LPS heptosyltransferase